MTDNIGSTTNQYDAAGRLYGIDCPRLSSPRLRKRLTYPDFIIGGVRPTTNPGWQRQSLVVGDVKLSGNSGYNKYTSSTKSSANFDAITRYAATRTQTRTALFLTVFTGNESKLAQVRTLLAGDGLKDGLAVVVVAASKNKDFNDLKQ